MNAPQPRNYDVQAPQGSPEVISDITERYDLVKSVSAFTEFVLRTSLGGEE